MYGARNSGAKMFTIRITGNGFLYNMVRIIAGTLVQVGKGQLSADDVAQMLEAKDRTAAGQTAPPQGLTLMNIAELCLCRLFLLWEMKVIHLRLLLPDHIFFA